MSQDNKDFTLEDILAEQRAQREIEAAQRAAQQDLRCLLYTSPSPRD